MELNKKILKELKRLGIDFDLHQKNNFEDFPHIDFSKLPKCYEQILFSVKWPDKKYYIMEDDLEDGEVDFENFDFDDEEQWECIRWHQIEFWEHPVGGEHSSMRPKEENNYGDQVYQQIGNTSNYVIFLDLTNVCSDGDPLIHLVYPYEPEGENIYLESKLSDFIIQLVELVDANEEVVSADLESFEGFTQKDAIKWIEENGGRIENTTGIYKVNFGFTDFKNFEIIKYLPEIEGLDISSTKVNDFILYKNLISLKSLSLYELELKSVEFLKELKKLEELTLPKNEMDFNLLSELSLLKKLSVSYTNKNFSKLECLNNLEMLSLYGCSLKKIDFLKSFSNLKILNLFGTGIESIEALAGLKKPRRFKSHVY